MLLSGFCLGTWQSCLAQVTTSGARFHQPGVRSLPGAAAACQAASKQVAEGNPTIRAANTRYVASCPPNRSKIKHRYYFFQRIKVTQVAKTCTVAGTIKLSPMSNDSWILRMFSKTTVYKPYPPPPPPKPNNLTWAAISSLRFYYLDSLWNK
jgi:hypothetical protein